MQLNEQHGGTAWRFGKSVAENELKDVLQEKNCLNLELVSLTQKALQYDQVKLEYDQLRETLNIVTQKRDLAVKEKIHLQAKLENLEQVLTHMREAAERRQQLELEHEQAFAVLNAKQQEINLLQKAQVEAKKEHEGAVQLLEAKVRELEQKCRTQSEQFNLLSKELEKFRLQAGHFDLLSANSLAVCDTPGSPSKSLSQLLHALAIPIGKGSESPSANRSLISEFIRPIQISGDKPELLSVKPTFLTRSHPSSLRRGFLAEMDNEPGSTSSKVRYTGKVRLCIARYSYNPYDGPNENPEAELPLIAGKYIYVYGNMDEDGFYEGELLDGQRGLVPSNFVDFIQDEEVPSVQTADNGKDQAYLNHTGLGHERGSGILTDSKFDGSMSGEAPPTTTTTTTTCNNGAGTLDVSIDEIGEDIVPYPRKINLIKQLAKSVIVGWEPPVVPPAWGTISGYNVLVDKEVRMSIPFGGRTKFLIEKLNLSACTYRISIQSITGRGISEELRCTMLVGKDVVVAPYQLRVDNITQVSAELSWWPSNSNYSHTIFLNDVEYDMVKAASYRYQFFNLKPNMAYKVKVVAQPHQMPWQLPLEQREKREITVEFCTQPAGPPAPPLDVMVQSGPAPGLIQVSWKPPPLTQMGMSNGASVIGYAVCTRGQKVNELEVFFRVAEVMFPTADSVMVELMRLQCLGANEVIVRTISAQGESQDSPLAVIPHSLLLPPVPHPRSAPNPKPLASAREPETKEEPGTVHSARLTEPWEPARSPSPIHPGHSLEPPHFHSPSQGRRSPSPQRILPQPQGAPIPNTVAKAIAREAAQRVAESNRMEKRNIFSERSTAIHPLNSDEEEDGYESPHRKRQGASVDEFLRGSELGRQPLQYSHSEDYQTESSRGSDLSDIMEEDEEELYSEMQLEEGGRRRSITSHSALKILGDPSSTGRADRMDHSGRRLSHGSAVQQRPRPMMVPSIEITMDSNSEAGRSRPGGQRNVSPVKEDVYYRTVPGHRKWPLQRGMASEHRYDGYGGRERHSPEFYEESEPEDMSRIFVALFDYDPLSMSPNPDAADEELPFKEGQIMKVYGDKDTDGFYRGEICGRDGLIPCNMVSEIQTDDDEMMEKLIKQGFLPLNTPVEKIERNRRSGRQHSVSTTRMVALYDYDPRESSPNVDVEAELTFCAGDIITVFGEIDEDGFYYGEINGHKGLVPSNFLEEVPDDVEVYLSETPSRHAHDTPVRTKTKRVPSENTGPSRRAPSPTVHPGSGPGTMGMGSPIRGREFSSKKKKGLLSKGKKLLKKLGAVK
ncbi:RIMS-binding protein 2-like [Huso huso]|uniref:RIMS-binding protein 2-like n=1 Tax=Huso huso TaxID=61971 RepID=A0ABR0YVM6_HUSHU